MNGNARLGAVLVGAAVLAIGGGFVLGRWSPATGEGREGPGGGGPGASPGSRTAAGTQVPADRTSGGPVTGVAVAPDPRGGSGTAPADSTAPRPREGGRASLADLVADLHAALQADDSEAISVLLDRLAAWIGQDPARALQVVARLAEEVDPQAAAFLVEALRLSPVAAQDPSVAEALLGVARSGAAVGARVAALGFLAGGSLPDARMIPAVLDLTARATDPHLRGLGANLLAGALERRPPGSAEVFRFLVDLAAHDPLEDIRGSILQSLPLRHADAGAVEAVGAILGADPAVGVRATAALALGDPPRAQAGRAVAVLQSTLGTERDPEVRRTVLTSIVRAQRLDALPLLERLAADHPDLRPHIEDYRKILATGETDMDRIWEQKQKMEFAREAPGDDHHHGPETD